MKERELEGTQPSGQISTSRKCLSASGDQKVECECYNFNQLLDTCMVQLNQEIMQDHELSCSKIIQT